MSWVVFFDGDCVFCTRTTHWLAAADRRKLLNFASLQGRLSEARGLSHFAGKDDGSLVLLRESDDSVFIRSDAVIELARVLGWPWRLLVIGILIPRPVRDWLYRLVARHRHRLAGECRVPDEDFRDRLRD